MKVHPSIAIIGAGAIGGYYGGRLAQRGMDVHFLLRAQNYDAWQANGLQVRSVAGDFSIPPETLHIYRNSADMPAADLIIVAIKTTENSRLPALLRPILHADSTILTLQNGLGNEQFLSDVFGAGRVVGGLAFVCINRIAPGIVHHLDHGVVRIGEFVGVGDSPRARQIVELFNRCDIRAEVLPDLMRGRWDKQVWNIPFNGLGALLDATTDRLIDNPVGEKAVRDLMLEVMRIAEADGVILPPDVPQRKIDATRTMGAYLSSTQVDRRNDRPMEVEAIFGKPLQIARQAGLKLASLEFLYYALSRIDRRLDR